MRGYGPAQRGTIDPATGRISLPFTLVVEVDSIDGGFPYLGADCMIGPLSTTLVARDYSDATGLATLSGSRMPVAAVSNCGDQNGLINDILGLPGTSSVEFNTWVFYA